MAVTVANRRWVLSGGLASGKSKVRELLQRHGVVGIDADSIGHLVLERDGAAFAEVSSRWPRVVVGGQISRPALASIVFNDNDELTALESITHPHIFGMIQTQVERIDSTVVVEIPVLDHGLGRGWRRMVVDGRDEIRVRRAVARGMTESDARSRMASQPPRSSWLAAADLVIPNQGDQRDLASAVTKLSGVL